MQGQASVSGRGDDIDHEDQIDQSVDQESQESAKTTRRGRPGPGARGRVGRGGAFGRDDVKRIRRLQAIAAVVRDLRAALGQSQKQLAENSGISKGYVGRLESVRTAGDADRVKLNDLTMLRFWDLLDALHTDWSGFGSRVSEKLAGTEAPRLRGARERLDDIIKTMETDQLQLLADFGDMLRLRARPDEAQLALSSFAWLREAGAGGAGGAGAGQGAPARDGLDAIESVLDEQERRERVRPPSTRSGSRQRITGS